MSSRCAYHLNLLMESERVSSSPVRFRVMMPVLSILACLGLAIWWAILGGQLMLAKTTMSHLENELRDHDAQHREAIKSLARLNDLNAQLAQLDCYSNSIVRRGEMLASLAEIMPLKIQLVKLDIAAQNQSPATTSYVERTTMALVGRTPKETPVMSLMESLEGEAFATSIKINRDPRNPDQSPKVRSFKQDVAKKGEGNRMLVFDIEYLLTGRRFGR